MDFNEIDLRNDFGELINPYASKINGKWVEGSTSTSFLNKHFGHLETAEEMKNATESEGLKLYFDWLKEKGILG